MSDHQEDDLSAIDDTGSALPDSWFQASNAHDLEEGMKILQAAQKGEHGASDETSANGEESGLETDDEGYGGEAAEPSFYSGRKRKLDRLGAGRDDVPVPGAGAQLMPKKLTEEETAKARKPVHSIFDNVALVHSIFDTGLLDTGFEAHGCGDQFHDTHDECDELQRRVCTVFPVSNWWLGASCTAASASAY